MIAFNKPYLCGEELSCIADSLQSTHFSGDGWYAQLCCDRLKKYGNSLEVLLTPSCTASLEMAAILAEITEGDEVIMPSFTFVSTANAFAMRGGIPVFVDIKEDTLNLDEKLIEDAITDKTKAIVAVHYAGGGCNMDAILEIAALHDLLVIEDAAHALGGYYKGYPLGAIGDIGCFSFHETKNVSAGEGGAIFINNERLVERARIIRDKGTNRYQYAQGIIKKYTWVDFGSSYLPNEISAAFLFAQLQHLDSITRDRLAIWDAYNSALSVEEYREAWITPKFEEGAKHNGHIYYLRLPSSRDRDAFISYMTGCGINCAFHYVPLHSSPFGKRVSRTVGSMNVTNRVSDTLVRLPLWVGIEPSLKSVIGAVKNYGRVGLTG